MPPPPPPRKPASQRVRSPAAATNTTSTSTTNNNAVDRRSQRASHSTNFHSPNTSFQPAAFQTPTSGDDYHSTLYHTSIPSSTSTTTATTTASSSAVKSTMSPSAVPLTTTTRRSRQPRFVRKEPLWKRISNAPADWLLQFHEDYIAEFWSPGREKAIGNYIAIGLNSLLIFAKLLEATVSLNDDDDLVLDVSSSYTPPTTDFQSDDGERVVFIGSRAESASATFLKFYCLLICFLNTLYLFSVRKSYRIYYADSTAHLNKGRFEGSTARRVDVDSETLIELDNENFLWKFTFSSIVWLYEISLAPMVSFVTTRLKALGKNGDDGENQEPVKMRTSIWELKTWDPAVTSLTVFCWFSPPAVLTIYYSTSSTLSTHVPLSVFTGFCLSILIKTYTSVLKDKQIVYEQTMHEYNTKFVHPNLPKSFYSVAVGTNDDPTDIVNVLVARAPKALDMETTEDEDLDVVAKPVKRISRRGVENSPPAGRRRR